MKCGYFFCIISCFLTAIFPQGSNAEDKYLRVVKDDSGEVVRLETELVSLSAVGTEGECGRAGVIVDLIGAVHIADSSYYERLNRHFQEYDALLYELIADPGVTVADSKTPNPLSALQLSLKDFLQLEFQLEKIDYNASNFVHADLSFEEFQTSMKARGETFTEIFFRLMVGSYLAGQKDPINQEVQSMRLLLSAFSPNRALIMKRVLAEQLTEMDEMVTMIVGEDGGTIISERNNKAIAVMCEQIKLGKRKIGIFYGAGHLLDLEQKLGKDVGLKRTNETWLTAWNLEPDNR